MIEYLTDNMMIIEVWGKQKPPKTKKNVNTKDLLSKQALAKGAAGGDTNTTVRPRIDFLCTYAVTHNLLSGYLTLSSSAFKQ